MDRWDVALLVVAGYFAVMTLVRLMIRRREQLVVQLRARMEEEEESAKPDDEQVPLEPSESATSP